MSEPTIFFQMRKALDLFEVQHGRRPVVLFVDEGARNSYLEALIEQYGLPYIRDRQNEADGRLQLEFNGVPVLLDPKMIAGIVAE
jgi:hypothetical protein